MRSFSGLFDKGKERELAVWQGSLSYELIFQTKSVSIARLRVDERDGLLKAITLILIDFSESLGGNLGMSVKQIQKIALELVEGKDFYFLTLADLSLFVKMVLKGEFGELYRMDVNVLFSKLRDYVTERTLKAVGMSDEEHERYKWGQERDGRVSPDLRQVNREALGKFVNEKGKGK